MKKIKLLIMIIISVIVKRSDAQNKLWSLPPKYMDQNNILHDLPQTLYSGQEALNTHAAIADKNGDLLFYIVDNILYTLGSNAAELDIAGTAGQTGEAIGMGTEIVIVPFPDNCYKYYLFYSVGESAIVSSGRIPKYSILNLDPSLGYHDLEGPYDVSSIPYNPSEVDFNDEQYKCTYITVGVTKANVNNERFLFYQLASKVVIYKINNTGVSYVSAFNMLYRKDWTGSRAEMEIVELANSYRLAYSYRVTLNDNINPIEAYALIDYVDINKYTGLPILSTGNTIFYPEDNNEPITNRVYIHGLEFSPDGSFLYITHDKTTLSPSSIDVYEINSSNPPTAVPNIPSLEAEDFENSQIEFKDNKMHFVCNDRIATFDITTNQWNNAAVTFSTYGFSYYPVQSLQNSFKTFQLIDQIDGMDYNTIGDINVSVSANPSLSICEGESVTLTASGADTYEWEDSSNPGTILYTGNPFITPALTSNVTYTVHGYKNGCDGQTSVSIVVNQNPEITSLEDVILCDGDNFPVVLNAGYGHGYSYSWTFNGNPISGITFVGTFNGPNATVNVEGEYCAVKTKTSTGCASEEVCATVEYDPRLDYSPEFGLQQYYCNESNPTFNVEATFPLIPSGLSYAWYVCEVDDASGSNPTNCANNPSYWWTGGTSQDFDPEYTFYKDQYYKIKRAVWSSDGCVSWTEYSIIFHCTVSGGRIVFSGFTHSDDDKLLNKIHDSNNMEMILQPNPTTGIVTLSIENTVGNELIQVIDYTGKVVLSEQMRDRKQIIDINHLSNGIYFVRVVSGNNVKVEKLIKN